MEWTYSDYTSPDERLAKLSSVAGEKPRELPFPSASDHLGKQGKPGAKAAGMAPLSAPDDWAKSRRGVSYNPKTGIIVIPRSPFFQRGFTLYHVNNSPSSERPRTVQLSFEGHGRPTAPLFPRGRLFTELK